ncbi:MAG: Ig-like domain-containing protein, partial [Planctomycetota bacterium]|nr:Ig-like domain-containing protein [Planctomycetota bacterium]
MLISLNWGRLVRSVCDRVFQSRQTPGRRQERLHAAKRIAWFREAEVLEVRMLLASAGPKIQTVGPTQVTNAVFQQLTVTFDSAIDASTFSASDVAIVGPAGVSAVGVTSVNPISAASFQVNFTQLPVRGSYQLTIGPDVRDLSGRLMDQDNDGVAGEGIDDVYRTTLVNIQTNAIFASATTISASNSSFEGKDLLINGATVTIDGPHSFNSVHIINGGILTHSAATTSSTSALNLTVAQQVIVDTASSIDASGRGYLAGRTQGNAGWAVPNYVGGSYGGVGGGS